MKKRLLLFISISFIFNTTTKEMNKQTELKKNKIKQKKIDDKKYISAQELLENSFKLGQLIFESGFRPTFLIALWRGGAPVGIAIEEYFSYKKMPIDKHVAIRTSAYNHDKLKSKVQIFDMDYVVKNIKKNDRLLIVDDIVDSGSTITKFLEEIKIQCGKNTPDKIRVAAVYYKPKTSSITPYYYIEKVYDWLIFPHEIKGLRINEIAKYQGSKIANSAKGKNNLKK